MTGVKASLETLVPTSDATWAAVRTVSRHLGTAVAWYHRGRFHFIVGDDWTVALSPDSAGRLRVDGCHLTVPRATRWVAATDLGRLTEVVDELASVRMEAEIA